MNISVGQIWSKVSQFEFSGGCKKKKSIYSKYFVYLFGLCLVLAVTHSIFHLHCDVLDL